MPTLTEQYNELASLVEAAGGTDADLMKSLNTLIKYNQGKFKSAKQAKFLYTSLLNHETPAAKRWGQRWLSKPNAIAVALMDTIKGFGVRTASKIRMYGFLYVVDGGGVVRAAKANIDHKGGFVITGEKELKFERKGNAPVLYDHEGELAAKAEKAKANAPMIAKLKGIPEYGSNNFLQDLVWQLEAGRKLTPGQLRAVNKYIPVEIGEYGEWAAAYQEGMQKLRELVELAIKAQKKVVSDLAAHPGQYEMSADNAQYFLDTYEGFLDWFRKPTKSEEFGMGSNVYGLIRDLGFRGGNNGEWPLTGLWALGVASKRKAKTGKATIRYVRDGMDFVKWLKRVNAIKVAVQVREGWMMPKQPGPFAKFD